MGKLLYIQWVIGYNTLYEAGEGDSGSKYPPIEYDF